MVISHKNGEINESTHINKVKAAMKVAMGDATTMNSKNTIPHTSRRASLALSKSSIVCHRPVMTMTTLM